MSVNVSTSFTRGRDGDLVTITYNVITGLKSNSFFPNPPAALAEAEKSLPEYQEALSNAAGRDRTMVSIKNDKRAKLRSLLALLAAYVIDTCKGDKSMLLSSGFIITGVKGEKALSPVNKLEVEIKQAKQATTSVERVTGARAYIHQYTTSTPTDETVWISEGTANRHYTFTALKSGVQHWFRVIVIGLKGKVLSPVESRFIQ
jgi:hypothetical protein